MKPRIFAVLLALGACRTGPTDLAGGSPPTAVASTPTEVASTPDEAAPVKAAPGETAPDPTAFDETKPDEVNPSDSMNPAAEPEPEPATEPEPPPENPSPSIDVAASPTSSFRMLLVPKRIRGLPYAQDLVDVFAPLPDVELLVDRGRLDPLQDLNHVVIASTDVRDWTRTMIALEYRLSRKEMQQVVERAAASNGQVVEWITDDGPLRGNPRPRDPDLSDADQRWFLFLDGKVLVYAREEFLPAMIKGRSKHKGSAEALAASISNPRRFAKRAPKASVQWVFRELGRGIKKAKLPFEVPNNIEFIATASREPTLSVRLEFADEGESKAFHRWWREDLRAIIDKNFTLKFSLGGLYELAKSKRNGATVSVRGQLNPKQYEMILGLFQSGSRQLASKSIDEMAEMRRRRAEAMAARKDGALPPSSVDAKSPGQGPEAAETGEQ